ncbi:hypothetical protein TcasGA2_TC002511 [Tribolium castaneum]|uniref:Uncharacterized protein n=1 Tax=Tribolium castaneum TaxID=7070 RepID=D6WH76_TRICA|nr:hypothetical protein TcasGA2_TC002511 [Tribolium castaneum]
MVMLLLIGIRNYRRRGPATALDNPNTPLIKNNSQLKRDIRVNQWRRFVVDLSDL